jgi:hypothetical protein
MAPLKFIEAIDSHPPIDIYHNGDMKRDFRRCRKKKSLSPLPIAISRSG